ncbi:MAG: hypothetical protein V7749_03075 [Cocleimonas sp.]
MKNQKKLKMSNQPTVVRILLGNRLNQFDDLSSAARLAKTLKVSLQATYLEEEDLICAAELSISSDISRWSAKEKAISSDSVQQAFHSYAMHQKRDLKRAAEQEKIEFGFDVVRGERDSWIIDEIKRNSLLFVAHQNVNRNICNNFNYSFLNKSVTTFTTKDPVKVIFNGSNASIRALKIAIQVTGLSHRSLTVLLDTDTFENEINLREQLNKNLDKYSDKHKKINVNAELMNTQEQAMCLAKHLYMLVYPVEINEENEIQQLNKLLQNLHSPLILVG